MNIRLHPFLLTALAMVAFAANSVLTRLALAPDPVLIDPASFAVVRVVSGAATLWLILLVKGALFSAKPPGFWMPLALFVYVAGFTFAYLSLDAGTGALILFGAVQLTMFGYAMRQGERFSNLGWAGLAMAVGGIIVLVSPGATAPDFWGTLMMLSAGIAWGVYSLLGRHVSDPLAATAWNFLICLPLVVIVSLIFLSDMTATPGGLALAIASGALASGLGYVIWYAALPMLSAGRASAVQLSVPAIAALGGALLLAEPITIRVLIASLATLGGVGIVLAQRGRS